MSRRRGGVRTRYALQHHLVLLVVLATLPSVTVAWVFVITTLSEYRHDNVMRLQDTSRALVLAIDREIGTIVTALNILSWSPELDRGFDLASFQAHAVHTAETLRTRVALYRTDGTQLMASWRSLGEPRQSRNQVDVMHQVVADGRARVTDAFLLERLQTPVAKVFVPVLREGQTVAVLDALLTMPRISALLVAQLLRPGAFAVVADGQGMIVGGTSRSAQHTDVKLPDWLRRESVEGEDAAAPRRGSWADGIERVCELQPVSVAQSWRVVVCENGRDFDAVWEVPLLLRVLGTAAALISAAVAASALARRLVRPLQVLTRNAEAVAFAGVTEADIDDSQLTQIRIADPEASGPASPNSGVAEFEALKQSLYRAERVLLRRTRAEHMALLEARTSQQLLSSVVNNAAEQISVKDLEGRYLLVNRAALIALGFGPGQESRLQGLRTADVFPSETARVAVAADQQVTASGRVITLEMPFINARGVSRQLSMSKAPWYDANGKLSGIVTVARDMTEERAADARLRRLQAALQRATRLSAMGAMASGLAHEVNQPLAASTNFLNAASRLLDRVRRNVAATHPVDVPPDAGHAAPDAPVFDQAAFDTARVALADASAQMLRAGDIVRRLRDFVGRGESEMQPEDVAGLLSEAASLAQVDFAVAGVELCLDCPPAIGLVTIDRTQMLQVLLNLIRNAAEAIQGVASQESEEMPRDDDASLMPVMPPGSGRITLAARRAPDHALVITVTDTGPGFSRAIGGHVFEPFISSKPSGMGIGLVICRTIVEGHGGQITAGPAQGGGAMLTVTLPGTLSGMIHA